MPYETVVDTVPISKHLLGRRRHARLAVEHAVECVAGSQALPGRVLDLSRVGALILLTDPEFHAESNQDLFTVAGRLALKYADGMQLQFTDARIQTRARIVRVAREEDRSTTVIGCEFARPLTFRECRLLKAPFDEGARNLGA